MGVQRRYVPHLKGLIYGKVEPKDQGRGSTITLCHAHLKKAILRLKTAIIRIFFRLTVGSFDIEYKKCLSNCSLNLL